MHRVWNQFHLFDVMCFCIEQLVSAPTPADRRDMWVEPVLHCSSPVTAMSWAPIGERSA